MTDWAKYIQCVLAGHARRGRIAALSLRPAVEGASLRGKYALGWGIHDRPWAAASPLSRRQQRRNYCVVWVAPLKNFAVLTATNRGGDGAPEGLDKLCA